MENFIIENSTLIQYTGPGGAVVVPDGVTALDARAFQSCGDITSLTIGGRLTAVGDGIFSQCKSLRMIVAPRTSLCFWAKEGRMLSALRGYLAHGHGYQAPEIVEEYERWIAQRQKLLPMIFREDAVRGLAAFARNGVVTAENFESDFLQPAQKAQAKNCVAFLLDWQYVHIPQAQRDLQNWQEFEL